MDKKIKSPKPDDNTESFKRINQELVSYKKGYNNLLKQNKHLNDKVQNLEYRSSLLERRILQLEASIDRIMRVFK